MTVAVYVKDPDAVLDYVFDWSRWLAGDETIVDSNVEASAGINLDSQSNSSTAVTAWISGGTTGQPYTVTNRITTNLGRIDDRTITIRVTPR
jgi:hypothetical protein